METEKQRKWKMFASICFNMTWQKTLFPLAVLFAHVTNLGSMKCEKYQKLDKQLADRKFMFGYILNEKWRKTFSIFVKFVKFISFNGNFLFNRFTVIYEILTVLSCFKRQQLLRILIKKCLVIAFYWLLSWR